MANWHSNKMHECWRLWSRAHGKGVVDPEKVFNAGFRAGVKAEAQRLEPFWVDGRLTERQRAHSEGEQQPGEG